jgi:hypothetical protein
MPPRSGHPAQFVQAIRVRELVKLTFRRLRGLVPDGQIAERRRAVCSPVMGWCCFELVQPRVSPSGSSTPSTDCVHARPPGAPRHPVDPDRRALLGPTRCQLRLAASLSQAGVTAQPVEPLWYGRRCDPAARADAVDSSCPVGDPRSGACCGPKKNAPCIFSANDRPFNETVRGLVKRSRTILAQFAR